MEEHIERVQERTRIRTILKETEFFKYRQRLYKISKWLPTLDPNGPKQHLALLELADEVSAIMAHHTHLHNHMEKAQMLYAWKLAPKEAIEHQIELFGYEPDEMDKIWKTRELYLEVYPDGMCEHDRDIWGNINMNIQHMINVMKKVDIKVPEFLYL